MSAEPAWRPWHKPAHDSGLPGGVSLGSAPSEELREELERLRAIEQRVHVCAERSAFEQEWVTFILTGEGIYGEAE